MRYIAYYVVTPKAGRKIVHYLSAGGYTGQEAMAMRYRTKETAMQAASSAAAAMRTELRQDVPFYVQEVER